MPYGYQYPRASNNSQIFASRRFDGESPVRGVTPVIILDASELRGPMRSLVDTGAEVNLIKIQALNPRTVIAHEAMSITGITKDSFNTAGSPEVDFFEKSIKIQVITSILPVEVDGI